jgi:hypothetical protein
MCNLINEGSSLARTATSPCSFESYTYIVDFNINHHFTNDKKGNISLLNTSLCMSRNICIYVYIFARSDDQKVHMYIAQFCVVPLHLFTNRFKVYM